MVVDQSIPNRRCWSKLTVPALMPTTSAVILCLKPARRATGLLCAGEVTDVMHTMLPKDVGHLPTDRSTP
jgi:ribosomal protein S5